MNRRRLLLLILLLPLPLLLARASGGRAPAVETAVAVAGEEVAAGGTHREHRDTDPHAAHHRAPAPLPDLTPREPLVATRGNGDMVRVPAGSYVPLFQQQGETETHVAAFQIDRRQVTRGEYLEFVRANPRWRKSQVKRIFADEHYLADWAGDLDAGDAEALRRPVTQVSWFAAKAYCEAQGARLPTVDEWEYVAAASAEQRDASRDPAFQQWLLELYTRPAPRPLAAAGSGFRNAYGIHDLHGPVREWVLDYNSALVSDDSREIGARDRQLNCAGGAVGATRTDDFAAFLRYTFRSGLDGRSTVDNLGFRCARSV